MAMMSNVHEVQTVYHAVQDPQTVLLSEKGAHGISVRCEKVCTMLNYSTTSMYKHAQLTTHSMCHTNRPKNATGKI